MRGIAKALIITATAGAAVSAATHEGDNPAPGQFRPDPLEPVRVYTYPDDYEKYYGGAAPGLEFKFEVNDADATFEVDSSPYWLYDLSDSLRLYPDFVSAYEVYSGTPYVNAVIPSLELIGQRGKFFDEGAYAAAEFRLDEGTAAVPGGRVGFYGRLAAALAERYETASGPTKATYADAAAYVATGVALAHKGGKVPKPLGLPPEIAGRAGDQAKSFLADFPEESKPVGFYTWNKELRRVWAHRKWFQFPLDTKNEAVVAMALALTAALQENAVLQAEYDAILAAHAGLTNPGKLRDCNDVAAVVGNAAATLDDLPAATEALARDPTAYPLNPDVFCLFPPAGAIEEFIWEAIGVFLKGDDYLFSFLIDSIKDHKLTLNPGPGAGCYQYQQYAAEVFLLLDEGAEGAKLEFDWGYRDRLEDAFRSLVTLYREAHGGGLGGGGAGLGGGLGARLEYTRIHVYPEVSLEPVPTYYLRLARSYGFLQKMLEDNFGAAALEDVRGIRERGKAKDDLADELADLRDLHYGLYLEACVNLGLTPELEPGEVDDRTAAIARAQRWLADWRNDPLMKKDIRVIIPVGWEGTLETEPYLKCWAIVGVEAREFDIKYAKAPALSIVEGDVKEGEGPGDVMFIPSRSNYVILTPRVIEITIPGTMPLDRDEFRKLCDRYGTTSEIAEALSSRKPAGRKKTVVHGKLRELITAEGEAYASDK